jgi:enoyl-CoA hydratase/carnithine racemase
MDTLVTREDCNGIATLTLNRAAKRNALNVDMFKALDDHLASIESAAGVSVVVLRANGSVFSAGADLGKQQSAPMRHFQARTIDRLAALPQPVIAAVEGVCFTGGLELVLAADIIVAAEDARFADTHARWALVPGWGLTQRLPRRIGPGRARLMMFSSGEIDGRTAEDWGLADLCLPAAAFETELGRLVKDIAANSSHSLRGYKRLLAETHDLPLAAGLAWERANSPGAGPDFAERIAGRFG